MRRAIILLLALLTLATAPAGAVIKADLEPSEREALTKAENYLSRIRSMKARFLQTSSAGGYAEGTVAILRPGRMRLEYDPPVEILIVADGRWLIYVDEELDQVSHLGLSSTPAGILLRNDVSFTDSDVTVTEVRRDAGVVEIDLVMTDDPAAGMLTLVFTENPFELRQWRVVDAQGVETTVSLHDVRTGIPLDRSQFRYTVRPTTEGMEHR